MVEKSHPQNRIIGEIPFLGHIWILRVCSCSTMATMRNINQHHWHVSHTKVKNSEPQEKWLPGFHKKTNKYPNHQEPNQQLTISWKTNKKKHPISNKKNNPKHHPCFFCIVGALRLKIFHSTRGFGDSAPPLGHQVDDSSNPTMAPERQNPNPLTWHNPIPIL